MASRVMHDLDLTHCPDSPWQGWTRRLYIQDAIDQFEPSACPHCLPHPDQVAHDVLVVTVVPPLDSSDA